MLASTGFCKEGKEECVCSIYSFVQVITVIGFKILRLLLEMLREMSMQFSLIESKLRALQILSDHAYLPR